MAWKFKRNSMKKEIQFSLYNNMREIRIGINTQWLVREKRNGALFKELSMKHKELPWIRAERLTQLRGQQSKLK
jgi:hypothetical protein